MDTKNARKKFVAIFCSCLLGASAYGLSNVLAQADAVCGNRIVEVGEECDDGNTIDGDGCSSECLSEIPDSDNDGRDNSTDVCPFDPDDRCDPDKSGYISVDQNGGTLLSADESIRIEIPPGAVRETTYVTIQEPSTPLPPPSGILGVTSVEIEMNPEATLDLDATVTLREDIPDEQNINIDESSIYRERPDGTLEDLPTQVTETVGDRDGVCEPRETCEFSALTNLLNTSMLAGIPYDCDPASCDDNNSCTEESCDEFGQCINTPLSNGTACDDGDACTSNDSCILVSDPGGTIFSDCQGDPCDDGNVCNGPETCGGEAGCFPGIPLDCDDGNACTNDSCDPSTGCQNVPVAQGTPCDDGNSSTCGDQCIIINDPNGPTGICQSQGCDDGNVCNGLETCGGAAGCQNGIPLNCDDGNECTVDSCDPQGGCQHVPQAGAACDDGNACTTGDTCTSAGFCQPAGALSCDDGNVCNGLETCDPGSGCIPPDAPLNCDDNNACTNDFCNPITGCSNLPVQCSDGNVCNGLETCDPNSGCLPPDVPLNCDDGNDCTVDSCDPSGGCQHTPQAGATCEDGDVCTTGDTCTAAGFCQPGAGCDDGDVCNGLETCGGTFGCQNGIPLNCDDNDPCTDDSCDGQNGCSNTPLDDSDNDGLCDAIDGCPNDPDNDVDSDGVCGDVDNCPDVYNPDQFDRDGNGVGEACEPGLTIEDAPTIVEEMTFRFAGAQRAALRQANRLVFLDSLNANVRVPCLVRLRVMQIIGNRFGTSGVENLNTYASDMAEGIRSGEFCVREEE